MNPAELLPQVYNELRKLAAAKLASEKPGHTLDATALVHDVFLKLADERSFASRSDYLKAAAQAMRRILVDHARARNAAKRGGGRRVGLETDHLAVTPRDDDIEALDEALSRLAIQEPKLAELVQLRHFGGLTLAQCAEVFGVSPRTVDTWWAYARAWLAVELKEKRHSRGGMRPGLCDWGVFVCWRRSCTPRPRAASVRDSSKAILAKNRPGTARRSAGPGRSIGQSRCLGMI
jgi:RNA polymerase sigma factor (TIGR02999 family)